MFYTQPLDQPYFQYKADNVSMEITAFNHSSTMYNWTNVSAELRHMITALNWSAESDEGQIELYINVPQNETSGDRETTIIVETASVVE